MAHFGNSVRHLEAIKKVNSVSREMIELAGGQFCGMESSKKNKRYSETTPAGSFFSGDQIDNSEMAYLVHVSFGSNRWESLELNVVFRECSKHIPAKVTTDLA